VDAQALFAPLGPTYERWSTILSLGQDPRWRRFLVSRLDVGPDSRVLDVATGTGLVAHAIVARYGCSVVGVDQSAGMLAEARRHANGRVELVQASAESLPFPDGEFDGLTFTYLLRYVAEPPAVLRELARVVRPGAVVAGLEFGLPQGVWRPLWELYVRGGLPAAGAVIGSGWREAGSFLGGSIRSFHAAWSEERLHEAWRAAGIGDVRSRHLSLGGGSVTWGRKGR
jgi:demethylmenaquinone methyltransferase / 2-methoxy-6-polyprenyl-1,4-benzoquinol methylase